MSVPSTTTRTDPRTTDRPVAHERSVLACVCACTVLVVGFVASINLAVPQLAAGALRPSASQLLWIVDVYVVLFACLVIPAGALGDRYGRKGVLLGGLALFAVGAAVSALASDVAVMLLGRAVTGVGAAGVLPNALAVLVHAVAPARRQRAIAVWAAMSGVGGVVGNVGGGAVLSSGSWRWLFAAAVPIALGCAVWAAWSAPRSARHERAVDLRAAVLLTLATLALLLAVVQAPQDGWTSPVVVGGLAASVGLFAAWVLAGLRAEQPLLDPRLFRIPALRAACLGMLIVFFGMFGFFYLNASLMQYVRGFTVLQAGLGVVPLTVPLLVAARSVPRLVARIGDRAVLAAAFAAIGIGLFGLAEAVGQGYLVYAAWMVLVGCGVTLALPALTIAISAALPREQAGVAGGLQATTREFGSALGVAVLGTVLTSEFVAHLHSATGRGAVPHTVAAALRSLPAEHAAVLHSFGSGAAVALRVVAVLVLVAGAIVIAELSWSGRRAAVV